MTMNDLAKGWKYVIGTHFCFPPIYARFTTKKGWRWTHDVMQAEAFMSKKGAEAHIAGNAGLKELMDGLDDAARRRIKVLQVGLTVSAADDD